MQGLLALDYPTAAAEQAAAGVEAGFDLECGFASAFAVQDVPGLNYPLYPG